MTAVHLTLPRSELQRMMPTLIRRQDGFVVQGTLHRRTAGNDIELLVPQLRLVQDGQVQRDRDQLTVRMTVDEHTTSELEAASLAQGSAILEIGAQGAFRGLWSDPAKQVWPMNGVFLPGSGMHRMELAAVDVPARERAAARWSRLAGALGLETLQRLRRMHVAIVGVGRNGSLMATSLARLGIQRLTLIDPDRIEPHNLDAMDGVHAADVGRTKIEAVGETIRDLLDLELVPLPLTRRAAVRAVATADLIISCVDHDGARLTAGILASAYLRPLLDIGTGIFHEGPTRRMGADLRLILPGDSRCLACFGGITRRSEVESLRHPETVQAAPWSSLRSGSLRSLNSVAVHLGLRQLEDLVDERITESLWLRLDYDGAFPGIQTITPRNPGECPICLRSGWGDAILEEISLILATLNAQIRI